MTDIVLALIALGVFVVAFALFRVANALWLLTGTHSDRQQEITEVLWAKTGYSREQWRKLKSDAQLAEFEQKQEKDNK